MTRSLLSSGSLVDHFPLMQAAHRACQKDGHREVQGACLGSSTPNSRMARGSREEKDEHPGSGPALPRITGMDG